MKASWIAGLCVVGLVATCTAEDAPKVAWSDTLDAALLQAQEEGKLVLQFRLIGRFNRPDC